MDSNLLNNLDRGPEKNVGDKSVNTGRPNIDPEMSLSKRLEAMTHSLKRMGTEILEPRIFKCCSITAAVVVLCVAIAVISVTNSYPHIVIPSKMKSLGEEMERVYEEKRFVGFENRIVL